MMCRALKKTPTFTFVLLLVVVSAKVIECSTTSNNKLQQLEDLTGYLNKNEYTCEKNRSFIWCLPFDYNNEQEPWRHRHITNTSVPWNYHFELSIFDVQEVNDRKQTITLNMYFAIKWFEPRMVINENAVEWNETKLN